MAKTLFKSTGGDLDAGRIQSIGVGLKEGEIAALDELAADLEVTRNALLRWAIRWFLVQYQAGAVNPAADLQDPPPTKKTLKLPG